MRPVKSKPLGLIKEEWESSAELRFEQIRSGRDVSYQFVILPCVLNLCEGSDFSSVVDVGCGSGFLVKEMSQRCELVVGVDMAGKNIELSKKLCASLANVQLINDTIENFAADHELSFSLAIANMTLITCVNLANVLEAIRKILNPGGTFVAMITHPCFWPDYWGYSSAEWFDYSHEIIIEAPFRISSEVSNCVTTHIHRPLSTYIETLVREGFQIDKLIEPLPDEKIASKYPSPWRYPRFLGIRCVRN